MNCRFFNVAIFAVVAVMSTACAAGDEASPDSGELKMTQHALKVDSDGKVQTCTGPDDATCNARGPGQALMCNPEKKCAFYTSTDSCNYPGLEGGTKACSLVPCGGDADCKAKNPDSDNLIATCIETEQSAKTDPGGECLFAYKTCTVAKDTPCAADGWLVCANNSCTCSASADKTYATTELCDNVDNDCDGKTDEDFAVGASCDGTDTDECKHGTYSCKSDKLGVECVNESKTNIAELCNSADDDCDGKTDEDFTTLGDACDGVDADKCKLGKMVCSSDNKSAVCTEEGKNVTEICDGKDNTCEGNTDEGCDDDGDKYCDASMGTAAGSTCKPGDCDDTDKDIHPKADELCDGKDNNCDNQKDEGFGLGDKCTAGKGLCGVSGTLDKCAADGKSATCSVKEDTSKKKTEMCSGVDEDCDGQVDEGCDDDKDGYCDANMTYASGASCKKNDCNDLVTSIHAGVTETCNNIDDNCDGKTDEGCDDDNDGYCDSSMVVGTGAKCKGSSGKGIDCNDKDAKVNPGVEEVCGTSYDDNCDGKTDVKADGKTKVCDACASVRKIACNTPTVIDMSAEANASNNIEVYGCWTNSGGKTLKTKLSAPEVVIAPDAKDGTKFSLQLLTTGTGTIAARLHASCKAESNKSVSSYNKAAGKNGTCAAFGVVSVSGGVAGTDTIVLDAAKAQKVTVQFICSQ